MDEASKLQVLKLCDERRHKVKIVEDEEMSELTNKQVSDYLWHLFAVAKSDWDKRRLKAAAELLDDLSLQNNEYHLGAQNDAVYLTRGAPPSPSNDNPNHDADREVVAKFYCPLEEARKIHVLISRPLVLPWLTVKADGMIHPDANQILCEIEEREAARVKAMPTEADAIRQFSEAVQRLKELGWNDPAYCPKDGSMFSVIEAGCTGIHKCNYQGEWPTGGWWVYDGDVWPSRPVLWRPRKDDDQEVDLGPCVPGMRKHTCSGGKS